VGSYNRCEVDVAQSGPGHWQEKYSLNGQLPDLLAAAVQINLLDQIEETLRGRLQNTQTLSS
jgi:hypothetical protein